MTGIKCRRFSRTVVLMLTKFRDMRHSSNPHNIRRSEVSIAPARSQSTHPTSRPHALNKSQGAPG
jgi:hypothetical protein